jgi:transposase
MMNYSTKYVGLDVSKDKISVAIASEGREDARYWGSIPHSKEAVRKLVHQLSQEEGVRLDVCYEAGPTGYVLYRWFQEFNVDCSVVASTAVLSQRSKIKTDKWDALRLAQLWRAKELTVVYVPTQEDEALRDLARAREDAVQDLNRHKQRLTKFLLRKQLQPATKMRLWIFPTRNGWIHCGLMKKAKGWSFKSIGTVSLRRKNGFCAMKRKWRYHFAFVPRNVDVCLDFS